MWNLGLPGRLRCDVRGRNGYNYAGLGLGHGDFNGDDDGDVLIGAPGADEGGPNHGTVYVLPGPIAAGAINAATVNSYITGEDPNDGIGAALGTVDHNADGVDDFILGAPDNSAGGTDAGSVYVVYGPIEGVVSLAVADLRYTGESASDKLGTSVSSAGDIDGDGIDDIIAGATLDDGAATNAGAAYVVAGGGTMDGSIDEYAFVKLTGEASEDQFGAHVVGNGDIDDDGMDDLMVSAPLAGGTYDTGTVYVFYGSLAGTISAAEAGARFDGSILGDQLGNSLAFAGDVDGDGNTAILIELKKDTTDVDAGGVYLMNSIWPGQRCPGLRSQAGALSNPYGFSDHMKRRTRPRSSSSRSTHVGLTPLSEPPRRTSRGSGQCTRRRRLGTHVRIARGHVCRLHAGRA